MNIETERLILRPWREEDAETLFALASNPKIGPNAGWPPHESIEDSLQTIQTVFSEEGTLAVCLKAGDLIGSIALKDEGQSSLVTCKNETEIGFWIGQSYWRKGYATEAAKAMIAYAFDDLGMERIWAGYFEGNDKSRRTQEKLGFIHHHTIQNYYVSLLEKTVDKHITVLEK